MNRDELLKNPYIKIMMAGRSSRGVNIPAEDCATLIYDDAICTRAAYVAFEAGYFVSSDGRLLKHHQEI